MITRETIPTSRNVSFYFDPICPWTWITSRWLVEVAEARGLGVDWRTMSLAVLNGGIDQMPERFQEGGRFSMRALRMMEAMRAAGFGDRIGELYTYLGTRLHVDREAPSLDLLRRSADAAGVGEFLPLAEDAWWDEAVVSSTWEAVELAGPDIGSPVIRLQGQDRGLHGPIVSPMPSGEEALRLWDALLTLTHVPGFFEVKHGRSGAPEIPRAVPAETRGSSRTDS